MTRRLRPSRRSPLLTVRVAAAAATAAAALLLLCAPTGVAVEAAAFLSRGGSSNATPCRVARSSARFSRSGGLYGMLPPPRGGDRDDADANGDGAVEAARRRLEATIKVGDAPFAPPPPPKFAPPKTTLSSSSSSSPPTSAAASASAASSATSMSALSPANLDRAILSPPPLTTIGRERLQAEIALLQSLERSDDALSELWSLWFGSRGSGPEGELLAAEGLGSPSSSSSGGGASRRRRRGGGSSPSWEAREEQEEEASEEEAERLLRSLIETHGIHWVEPLNRLSTLLYRQGRLLESRKLCEVVLAVKPWHFGALSGMVRCCRGLGDEKGARLWSERRLPPVSGGGDGEGTTNNNRRRIDWVRRAVGEATRSLDKAEEMVRRSFLDCDDDGDQGDDDNDGQDGDDGGWLPPNFISTEGGVDDYDAWQ